MVYKFFDKKAGSGVKVNVNEVLAQKLHKPVIKKLKTRKVNARFKDNIWAADFVKMGSLSSFNPVVKCLLCAIDVFTEYASVKFLTDKEAKTILNGFIGIVNEFKRKSDK